MTAPNISHQSGHARVFIDHDPMSMNNRMYIVHERHIVRFKDGDLLFSPLIDGVRSAGDEAALEWDELHEDSVIDIFKAIGKALEIYSDEPSQAYKQGFAEGESKVLREWNESLRG